MKTVWKAEEDFRKGGMWETWALKIQTRSQENGIKKEKEKGWCVGSGISNKFIWVGVTEIMIQRVSRTVLFKDLFLQNKFWDMNGHLSQGAVVNTITMTHLLCKKQDTFFLPASEFEWLHVQSSVKECNRGNCCNQEHCLWLVLTLRRSLQALGRLPLGSLSVFMLHIKMWPMRARRYTTENDECYLSSIW